MSKSIEPLGATLPDEHYKAVTMKWVDDIVIKHNFCPFARFVRTPNQIRCEVVYGDAGVILETLYNELTHLDSSTDTATTLLILPAPVLADFEEYLDILSIAEHMLQEWGYVGMYQLASFHPNYVFDGNTDDDAENFTNRSPYPVLHLIRESDISRYMKNEDDAEKIYTHNIQKANELGCPYFKETLSTIKRTGLPNGKP
ncbi:MAG: hypothetical protein AXW14_13945 [Alteromonas sp. Nap_26]|nr:MAG: hypothetical protein AXW14_13945 [Alteromonas sp. Nap_26]